MPPPAFPYLPGNGFTSTRSSGSTRARGQAGRRVTSLTLFLDVRPVERLPLAEGGIYEHFPIFGGIMRSGPFNGLMLRYTELFESVENEALSVARG
jgi:hypothetical protein